MVLVEGLVLRAVLGVHLARAREHERLHRAALERAHEARGRHGVVVHEALDVGEIPRHQRAEVRDGLDAAEALVARCEIREVADDVLHAVPRLARCDEVEPDDLVPRVGEEADDRAPHASGCSCHCDAHHASLRGSCAVSRPMRTTIPVTSAAAMT